MYVQSWRLLPCNYLAASMRYCMAVKIGEELRLGCSISGPTGTGQRWVFVLNSYELPGSGCLAVFG
jgi:hypothetical protein